MSTTNTAAAPGPWTVEEMDFCRGAWAIYASNATCISDFLGEADARLMAAGPELRDALRALVEHHDRFTAEVIGPELAAVAGDPPAIAAARDLLARLEGQ